MRKPPFGRLFCFINAILTNPCHSSLRSEPSKSDKRAYKATMPIEEDSSSLRMTNLLYI